MVANEVVSGLAGATLEGKACRPAGEVGHSIEDMADAIGRGHVFTDHVMDSSELTRFALEPQEDFSVHIQKVMRRADESKPLSSGRRAWHQGGLGRGGSGPIVIYEPGSGDLGTAFYGTYEKFRSLQ
jgi:hypothetical protein